MPVENQEPKPLGQSHQGWEQLANDARENWDLEHPGVAVLYENHVVPVLQGKGLGHLAITAEDRAGGRFAYKNADINVKEVDQVIGYLRSDGEAIPDKAGDRTAAYLKFMADTVNDGILTGDPESVRRQIEMHIIKTEDMPESHFALQRRIAREQGHGEIEVTSYMKLQLTEAAQADQRGSLAKWVEYLGGEDGSYPNWFKRYTWDSVTKLGAYDKEKTKFDRRVETTVAPFPELNREALAYTYDLVKKFHVQGNNSHLIGDEVDDKKLIQLLKESSFGRLYAYAITEVTPDDSELRNNVEGSWTLFRQTSDPRTARRLSGTLQGHGTGWCTAGESTAEAQLNDGDFYVYFTRDEDGKDTIPRVAIRMEQGEVAEVRGVLPSQELEPVLSDITSKQLENLPGGEEYIQKAKDMKQLTAIAKMLAKDARDHLTAQDVSFLYELNHKIEGFGYDEDPRVQDLQLKAASNNAADLLEKIDANAALVQRVRNHVRVGDIMDRASNNAAAEFSDSDLCFIYGLDGPIATLDPRASELAKAVDYWRNGNDRDRLFELMTGALERQFNTSRKAYESTARSLRIETVDHDLLKREFSKKIAIWQEQGVYEYILEQLIEHDTQFKVIMTPNVIATTEQIFAAARSFGEGQPYETHIYNELHGQYTGEELSGEIEPGIGVRFSLMPSKGSQELGNAPAKEQLFILEKMRKQLPRIRLRAPSVLDAVAHWQSLRAGGDTLSDESAYAKTVIRHFDLPPKDADDWTYVPGSCIGYNGRPLLNYSNAVGAIGARVLVG